MIEDPFYLAAGLVLLALGAALLFTHWRHGPAVALGNEVEMERRDPPHGGAPQ